MKKRRAETQTDPELQYRLQGIAPTLAATAPSPWSRYRIDLSSAKINALEPPVLLCVDFGAPSPDPCCESAAEKGWSREVIAKRDDSP